MMFRMFTKKIIIRISNYNVYHCGTISPVHMLPIAYTPVKVTA